MEESTREKYNLQVSRWLLAGVVMLVIQVVLGGITRLTESGLSITEWNPVTGVLPPLTDAQWQIEFDKYRQTDQFRFVHQSFGLRDFKFIFFWEWFHRLWARMMGMVFLIGFFYFLIRRRFSSQMPVPMVILFLLGALQGAVGWIMVKSGLVPEMYFVGHVELASHFLAAIVLTGYTLWFAWRLHPAFRQKIISPELHRHVTWLLCILILQFLFGALMAGLRAGSAAPTWPDINGSFFPEALNAEGGLINNLFNNKMVVQFTHRALAYLLFALAHVFYFRFRGFRDNSVFSFLRKSLLIIIWAQLLLGIGTVLNATDPGALVWWGTAHQFTGILLFICIVSLMQISRKKLPV